MEVGGNIVLNQEADRVAVIGGVCSSVVVGELGNVVAVQEKAGTVVVRLPGSLLRSIEVDSVAATEVGIGHLDG